MRILQYIHMIPMFILTSCSLPKGEQAPVALIWTDNGYNAENGYYDNQFIIKNISNQKVSGDWSIYYSQLPREIVSVRSKQIKIETVNANFFRISPTESYTELLPQDSIIVDFTVNNDTPNISQEPEGCYWTSAHHTGGCSQPLPIKMQIRRGFDAALMRTLSPQKQYENNLLLYASTPLTETDILPTVKQTTIDSQTVCLPSCISLLYCNELTHEAKLLQQKLEELYTIKVTEGASMQIILNLTVSEEESINDEGYKLQIDTNQILIESSTPHGVFNGTQTLLSLLKGSDNTKVLHCQTITDYPDLNYRGLMMDVARNFTTASNLKKLIDLIASYKLNVLHLHLSDDEGWRLEIPGLEELTEVGSHRGHTSDESTCLYPGYDGSYNPNDSTSGNGFYTRDEFIDILKYAANRHIRVIPEIESPGHARAAIVAMKARYNKYVGKDGNKARQYLLSEAEDTSKYVSAQSYTDNVINVALPSTYRFMEKVISEIQAMYREAGLELNSIHIGGDEVPSGAWMGSPVCRRFMKEHHMKTSHELFEYFFCQVAELLQQKNLKFNGWQEVALHNSAETNKTLRSIADGINCWSTVPEWDSDEIPYQIANNGYPVILSCVNHFYLDLAYSPHYMERGHSWAGYVDESKSFSMLPFTLYRSSRTDLNGNPVDIYHADQGKETLKNKQHIKGVQAQLFTETIRSFQWVEYYIFPKILGLVERAWNAHPDWEAMNGQQEKEAYYKDLAHFYDIISSKEMPYWEQMDVNFRLPSPGLKIQGGKLYANSPIQDAAIRYTTDGTEPDSLSPLWEEAIACNASIIKARTFYMGKESITTILINKQQ